MAVFSDIADGSSCQQTVGHDAPVLRLVDQPSPELAVPEDREFFKMAERFIADVPLDEIVPVAALAGIGQGCPPPVGGVAPRHISRGPCRGR